MNGNTKMFLSIRTLAFALLCAVVSPGSQAGLLRQEDLVSKNLVVFSTGAGQVALDGKSNDKVGPFAEALVPLISMADLSLGQILSKLDDGINEKSEGFQRIAVAGNWLNEFSFHANTGRWKKRVALVVGNAHYKDRILFSPLADAKAIGAALLASGFEVKVIVDANRMQMAAAVQELSESAGFDGLALVYFSGLGAKINGIDFIAPVDVYFDSYKASQSKDRFVEGNLSVNFLIDALRKARVSLLFIDACRDNPFAGK